MKKKGENQSLSFDLLETKYPDEWILLQVTEENDLSEPVQGIVLAHSKVKEEIIGLSKDLKEDIALFFTGVIPKKGYAFCF